MLEVSHVSCDANRAEIRHQSLGSHQCNVSLFSFLQQEIVRELYFASLQWTPDAPKATKEIILML